VFVVLAVLAGVSLVGLFQGSNENVANGLIAFHTFGAQGVMPAGNGMAIVVGANGSRIGLDRGRSSASVVLGILGLAMFPSSSPTCSPAGCGTSASSNAAAVGSVSRVSQWLVMTRVGGGWTTPGSAAVS